jgi:hypothetical protein
MNTRPFGVCSTGLRSGARSTGGNTPGSLGRIILDGMASSSCTLSRSASS